MKKDERNYIVEHHESCEKYLNKLIAVQRTIQLVTNKLDLLEPTIIPEKAFVVPTETIKRKKSFYQKKISFVSPLLNWKRALAFSAIAACLIIGFLFKTKSKPNYEKIFAHVVEMEQSFMSDSKKDYNENVFYISSFDKEKKQVEIIRTSREGEIISREKIQLN